MAYRLEHMGVERYRGLTVLGKAGRRWTGEVRLVPEALDKPLKWRKPRRIFVNSMSDLFHEDVPFEYIAAVFGVMAACPQHIFQVLTKRPARALEWFGWMIEEAFEQRELVSAPCRVQTVLRHAFDRLGGESEMPGRFRPAMDDVWQSQKDRERWPLPNVHLGVSCENQAAADERIPLLLACPAAIRFVSAEPLLGPVDLRLSDWHKVGGGAGGRVQTRALLRWVILGSESGRNPRPMETEWAACIVRQCREAAVPCFVKQIANDRDRKGGDPKHWPEGDWPREFPGGIGQSP
jgi:protein gp37